MCLRKENLRVLWVISPLAGSPVMTSLMTANTATKALRTTCNAHISSLRKGLLLSSFFWGGG